MKFLAAALKSLTPPEIVVAVSFLLALLVKVVALKFVLAAEFVVLVLQLSTFVVVSPP